MNAYVCVQARANSFYACRVRKNPPIFYGRECFAWVGGTPGGSAIRGRFLERLEPFSAEQICRESRFRFQEKVPESSIDRAVKLMEPSSVPILL